MDFIPSTATAEQLDVVGLITIFFGHINIVDGASHFFLKMIGQNAVDAQTYGFVGALFVYFVEESAVVNDANDIAMVDVLKIAS